MSRRLSSSRSPRLRMRSVDRLDQQVLRISEADDDLGGQLRMLLRQMYDAVGAPFGPSDEAMCIWWEHDQYTTSS